MLRIVAKAGDRYRCQRPSEAPKIEGSHSRLVNSHLADTGRGRACSPDVNKV